MHLMLEGVRDFLKLNLANKSSSELVMIVQNRKIVSAVSQRSGSYKTTAESEALITNATIEVFKKGDSRAIGWIRKTLSNKS